MNKYAIKKYLSKSGIGHIIWTAIFLIYAVFALSSEAWVAAVLCFLGSLYFFTSPLRTNKKVGNLLKKYEDAGRLDEIVKDFENGIYADKQNLRIGNRMIFSRRLHTIFDYDEVEKFYLCEEEDNTDDITTTYLCLYLQQKNGNDHLLIKLSKSRRNQDAMNMACEQIRMKWPSARFGDTDVGECSWN